MVRHTRRTMLKAAGTALGGLTLAGNVSASTGENARFFINLTEVSRSEVPDDVEIIHDLSQADVLVARGDQERVGGPEATVPDLKIDLSDDTTGAVETQDGPSVDEQSASHNHDGAPSNSEFQWDKRAQNLSNELTDKPGNGKVVHDTSTGEAAWESAIDGKLATMHRRGPSGDDIYVGTRDGTVQRIDISTGKTRWTFDVGEGVTRLDASTTPILVGDGETVYALSAEDGRVRWSRGFGSRLWAGLGEHSVASEAADGPARLYDRCDGDVLLEKGDEPLAVGANTVFTVSQGVLGAYRLGGTADESPGGGTVAFCPNCGADLTTYGGPSFCPECGTEIPE